MPLECGPMPNLTVIALRLTTAVSLMDSLTLKNHPPRIKHRVTSCYTAEVILNQTFICPTSCPKATSDLNHRWWDTHHVWYGRHSLATDWPCCFRFPDFCHIIEWLGSKCQLWVQKLAKIGFFVPHIFRGTYEHPHRTQFPDVTTCQFRENCFRDVEESVDRRKK